MNASCKLCCYTKSEDIKPQSLVTSRHDVRQRTRSTVITHFTMGCEVKMYKSNVQVVIPCSPFQLRSVPRLLEHFAGKQ